MTVGILDFPAVTEKHDKDNCIFQLFQIKQLKILN